METPNKQEKPKLHGQGVVRYFNWEDGKGFLHRAEFADCPKNCVNPAHGVNFNWQSLIRCHLGKQDIKIGSSLAYTAHQQEGKENLCAATLNPIHGQ